MHVSVTVIRLRKKVFGNSGGLGLTVSFVNQTLSCDEENTCILGNWTGTGLQMRLMWEFFQMQMKTR